MVSDKLPAMPSAGPLETRLGKSYRLARKAARKTLAETAVALGRSINYVRQHEAGHRMMRADDIVRSAVFFGCTGGRLTESESPDD